MAKKTDSTTKPTVAATPAPAKPPAAAPAKPVTAAPEKSPAKAAVKKKPTAKAVKAPVGKKAKPASKKSVKPAAAAYTREDVALRAYFIAEKRFAQGLPGSEHQDWLEAERQLAAENGKPKKARKA